MTTLALVGARVRGVAADMSQLPLISTLIMTVVIVLAVFAPWLSPANPYSVSIIKQLLPPGSVVDGHMYWLGTDGLGRDQLARLIYGAQTSLLVGAAGLLFGGGLGLIVGIVSGYLGGFVDNLLMRVTDCFQALPSLLLALVFVITIGPGLGTVIIALSVVTWSRFARIIRSEVLLLKEREFVLQARLANCSTLHIMLVHILPNVFNTFIVACSLQVSDLIITEATLSFLGAGVPLPMPTWGNMISEGKDHISGAWWIGIFPGVALTLLVFSFNTLGDWLRDRLDPRLRQL